MALSPKDMLLVPKLRKLGIQVPVRMIMAARKAGLAVPIAASILMQETGGGRNEWGHDPTIFVGGHDTHNGKQWGETVTASAYKAYLAQRGTAGHGGMQGVGPCQLTYYAYQDAADKAGGCWKPLPNMIIGFTALANLIRRAGLHDGIAAYNGTGSAAQQYADAVIARADQYAAALGVPKP